MRNFEPERLTLERALEAMTRETGLTAKVLRWEPKGGPDQVRPDALIEVAGGQGKQRFAVEVKNVDRFEILHHLRTFWPRDAREPLLVAAPYITMQLAERCREMGMCFADTAGNAYLRAPGLHIYVVGKRRPAHATPAEEGRAVTPAGLRIVFALLCQPHLLKTPYRNIAATARVALGTVGPVIKDLETRRHVTPEAGTTTGHRILDPDRLFAEWTAAFPTILKPKLNARKFRAPRPNWTEGVDLKLYGAYWGGEVAANRLLGHLQPATATIYAENMPTQFIVDHRLKADVNGDVEILDLFWDPQRLPGIRDVVPPALAYADLFTRTEGRDLEAAKMIYEQYIHPTLNDQA